MKTPLTASSTTDCKGQPLLFQDVGARKVVADFSGGTLSSDGGVLLLRQVDAGLGVTASLAQCFGDQRQQVYVDHTVRQLLAQRIYGLALGYEDLNDHEQLRHGMIHINLLTGVGETVRQAVSQPEVGIHLAQQQHAAIAGECAAGKIGHDLARTQVLKQQRLLLTVCRRRSGEWRFHLAE